MDLAMTLAIPKTDCPGMSFVMVFAVNSRWTIHFIYFLKGLSDFDFWCQNFFISVKGDWQDFMYPFKIKYDEFIS